MLQNLPKLTKNPRVFLSIGERRYLRTSPLRNLKFSDYDSIGIDLDHTLAVFNLENLFKDEYQSICNHFASKGYSTKQLSKPLDMNFTQRGLILDIKNGNVLQIDSTGKILFGCHGTRPLDNGKIKKLYGPDGVWDLTKKFAKDPLSTWGEPFRSQMRATLDYFDAPVTLAFARGVDTVDEKNLCQKCSEYKVFKDIIEFWIKASLDDFNSSEIYLFKQLRENPAKYVKPLSLEVLRWLEILQNLRKTVFLITGSPPEYSRFICNYLMGKDWKKFFNLIIYEARKPGFFTLNRPFFDVTSRKEIPSEQPLTPGEYLQGNYFTLLSFAKRFSGNPNPSVALIGDNFLMDILPAEKKGVDGILICEELFNVNDFYTTSEVIFRKRMLRPRFWGSMFKSENKTDTVWKKYLKKSKLSVPSLDCIASFPADYDFPENKDDGCK